MNGRISSELDSRLETEIADIGCYNACGSTRPSKLNVEQARNAAADDKHRLAGRQPHETLRADDASQRFDKRSFVECHPISQAKRSQLDIDLGHANIFGESTGIESRGPQHVADGLMSGEAITTLAAGHVVRSKNPIANPKIFDPLTYFHDFACDFVTQHQRGFLDAVPFHKIATANAARANAH